MMNREAFDLVARTLDYPEADAAERAASAARAMDDPALRASLEELARWLAENRLDEAQESYTRAFDLSPVCTLNVGYHLFGDTYDRGALLAGLMGELRRVGLEPGTELPDYLPNLVRLAARMEDEEDRGLLVREVLVPGLDRMNETLAKLERPWVPVLVALREVLAALVGGVEKKWRPRLVDESGSLMEAAHA